MTKQNNLENRMNSIHPRVTLSTIALAISLAAVLAFSLAIATPSAGHSATHNEVDQEALTDLQNALKDAGYQGDISEARLRQAYEEGENSAILHSKPNGCSTPKLSKVLTGKYDRIFKPACDTHDRCYSASSKTSRKSCDSTFRHNMNRICHKKYGKSTAPGTRSRDCIGTASIYYHFVRAFGKSHYKGKGDRS
ncbi:hypothetical protein [Brevibacterium otitidis]|uniref:Phospholipase A2 n=1 Tax=Brevibacterium otitidis TaxID=53364 RepID=A0ABV5WXW2_9MICO